MTTFSPWIDGQGRDAGVDVLAVDRDPGAAVLRQPALGDVQAGHDLEPADDRGHRAARDGHDVAQHAVDPVADPQRLALRLDVDVAGPGAHGVGEDQADQPDGRRVVGARAVVLLRRGHVDVVEVGRHVGGVLGQRPERVRCSRTWVSVATSTVSSLAPVCSRTSSRATTSVGSRHRDGQPLAVRWPARPCRGAGRPRGAAAAPPPERWRPRVRSTTSRPSWSARASAIWRSVATPRSTRTWPSRRREPMIDRCAASASSSSSAVRTPAATRTSPSRRRSGRGELTVQASGGGCPNFSASRPPSRCRRRWPGARRAPRAAGAARSAGSRGWPRRRPRSASDASSRVR